MTCSIIGLDIKSGLIGSAVLSHRTAVGACVPYFRAGVGFAHIQNVPYADIAEQCLRHIDKGYAVKDAIARALADDRTPELRQIGVLTLDNRKGIYQGDKCHTPANHYKSENALALGHTIKNEDIPKRMVEVFEKNNDLPIVERLILALEEAQKLGGDKEDADAAALRVYALDYPYQRFYPLDLRVDSCPNKAPIEDLKRLYKIFLTQERRVISGRTGLDS